MPKKQKGYLQFQSFHKTETTHVVEIIQQSSMTKSRLFSLLRIMVTDEMVTQGAKTSTNMF